MSCREWQLSSQRTFKPDDVSGRIQPLPAIDICQLNFRFGSIPAADTGPLPARIRHPLISPRRLNNQKRKGLYESSVVLSAAQV